MLFMYTRHCVNIGNYMSVFYTIAFRQDLINIMEIHGNPKECCYAKAVTMCPRSVLSSSMMWSLHCYVEAPLP